MIKQAPNLIVLDMDGVIMDVSASYREAVRMTTRLFFKGTPNWHQLPNPLISLDEIAAVKQTGGLNNDWDLTYRILDLLMSLVYWANDIPSGDPWVIHENVNKNADISDLIHHLTSHDTPLQYLLGQKDIQANLFVQTMSANDVGTGNVIKQIFQELYLGKDLFFQTYNLHPQLYEAEGLINREKLLVNPNTIQKLADGNLLAIATGRPKTEADYPLQKFKISKYFKTVLTLDDCIRAERAVREKNGHMVSFSKPHPYMLDTIAEIHVDSKPKCYYIGDMPDDMAAALRSKYGYAGIGFTASTPNKQALDQVLKEAGATHVINDFDELPTILNQSG
jgi:HAD superfamily hydrolase (TIGR01548 family)